MIYATVFVSPTSAGNMSDCTLNAISDMAVLVPLPSTAGTCQPLPAEVIAALFGAAAMGQNLTMTYALTMFDNQSIALQLMCYDTQCSQVIGIHVRTSVLPHTFTYTHTHTHTLAFVFACRYTLISRVHGDQNPNHIFPLSLCLIIPFCC
jgi:hypothetical protein